MHPQRWILIVAVALGAAYWWLLGGFVGITDVLGSPEPVRAASPAEIEQKGMQVATFAGGCFWSSEAAFDGMRGVVSTTVGYTGGHVPNPTYKQVTTGTTGHAEAVQVVFDAAVVSYDELLQRYWHNVDPTVSHRQFCDVGSQYRPEVFVHGEAQRAAAEASKADVRHELGQPVVVDVTQAESFYPAEEYHQDYHRKNAAQYAFYRFACGRDRRLEELWGEGKQ